MLPCPISVLLMYMWNWLSGRSNQAGEEDQQPQRKGGRGQGQSHGVTYYQRNRTEECLAQDSEAVVVAMNKEKDKPPRAKKNGGASRSQHHPGMGSGDETISEGWVDVPEEMKKVRL